MNPIYAVWAVPRSVSTAFERMCMERGDLQVLHEPFAVAYYLGPERRSLRFADATRPPDPAHGFAAVTERVLQLAERGPVLLKDMAYYVAYSNDADVLGHFNNSFLIRHPRVSLSSLYKQHSDFTEEESGFTALERLYDRECERTGRAPPLLDANDLCADPAGMVRAWCAAMGLGFEPSALTWTPGAQPEWAGRDGLHDDVACTSGFGPPRDPMAVVLPDARSIRGCYERSLAIYERLYETRLRPLEADA